MSIDLFIPECLFFTATWEHDDTSILNHDITGRLQLFCNYSHRLIALVDFDEEAELLLTRSRLHMCRRAIHFKKFFKPQIEIYLDTLARLGYKDDALAPEIVGANKLINESTAAQSIKKLIGDASRIVFDLSSLTFNETPSMNNGNQQPAPISREEINDVAKFMFSKHCLLDEYSYGRADLLLAPGVVAEIIMNFIDKRPVTLIINRRMLEYLAIPIPHENPNSQITSSSM